MPIEWRLASEQQRQLAAVAVLVALVAVGYWWMSAPSSTATVPLRRTRASATPSAQYVIVDIEGDVRRPGVLRLPIGARVIDAVEAAGGPMPGRLAGANLARAVVDGEQIVIGALAASGAGPTVADATTRVNINAATAAQLDALPGIGPVLAQRIVEYREAHGRFRVLRDLLAVPGIGDAKYADLAAAITVT